MIKLLQLIRIVLLFFIGFSVLNILKAQNVLDYYIQDTKMRRFFKEKAPDDQSSWFL
jgi:hypothetical protein